MAAVLACGPRAVVSHRSAAALWGLLPYPAVGEVCVTISQGARRGRPGIEVHRSGSLLRRDVRLLDGIPLTAAARTLLDVAASVPRDELERMVAQAQRQRVASRSALVEQLGRNRGRLGTAQLRAVIDIDGGPRFTRSRAERLLLKHVRAAALPAPATNVWRHGYELDFLWPASGIAVEVDSERFHSDSKAFHADRRRDADLAARGYTVLRFTWRQLTTEPQVVTARLAAALALRGRE
ncbi:MAG: DUF559 domain-containing protein [Thermoleophilaceae bacterium]